MILPLSLALMSLVSCSSESSSSTNSATTSTQTSPTLPTVTAPVVTTVPDVVVDAVSSATVLIEGVGYGDSSYEVFYKNTDASQLLLDCYPSADFLVFQALSSNYNLDSDIPIEVIHQTVRESLGDGYSEIRNSFNLISREEYYAQIASASNPQGIRDQYSLSFDDLAEDWFSGLTDEEVTLVKNSILTYYSINDLMNYSHHSELSGLDALIALETTLSELDAYLATQDEATQTTMKALANRVLYETQSVRSDEYILQFSSSLTVRELLDLSLALGEFFPAPLIAEESNLDPLRIEQYATSKHYGLSVIETILPTGSGDKMSETYSNLKETIGTDQASSKSVRLYLEKTEPKSYFVVTIQEMRYDANNIYTYLSVENATISTFNTSMAQELHTKNVQRIEDLLSNTHETEDLSEGETEEEISGEGVALEDDSEVFEESTAFDVEQEDPLATQEDPFATQEDPFATDDASSTTES